MKKPKVSLIIEVGSDEEARELLEKIYGAEGDSDEAEDEKPAKGKKGKGKSKPDSEDDGDDGSGDDSGSDDSDDSDQDSGDDGDSDDDGDSEGDDGPSLDDVIDTLKAYVGKNKKGEREKAVALLKKKFGVGNVNKLDEKHFAAAIKLFSK
jgi:hypothetical protein